MKKLFPPKKPVCAGQERREEIQKKNRNRLVEAGMTDRENWRVSFTSSRISTCGREAGSGGEPEQRRRRCTRCIGGKPH